MAKTISKMRSVLDYNCHNTDLCPMYIWIVVVVAAAAVAGVVVEVVVLVAAVVVGGGAGETQPNFSPSLIDQHFAHSMKLFEISAPFSRTWDCFLRSSRCGCQRRCLV